MGIQKSFKSFDPSQNQETTIKCDPYLNECASMVLDSSKDRWVEQLDSAYNILTSNKNKNCWYQMCRVGLFLSTTAFGAFLGQIIKLCTEDCNLVSHIMTLMAAGSFVFVGIFWYGKDKLAPDYKIAKHEICTVLKDIRKSTTKKEV